MGKGNNCSIGYLSLLFNATTFANIAVNATSAPLTNLYVSLHTADPTASGNQSSNEAAYTSYARVAVARTSSGWALTGESISPGADVVFPAATGGTETETFFGVGSASSGAGVLYYSGSLTPTIAVTSGVTPVVAAASTITEA